MSKTSVNSEKEQEVDFIKDLNEELQKLSSIRELYISRGYKDEFEPRILEGVTIPVSNYGMECGRVDIGEWISQYLADLEYEGKPQRVFSKRHNPFNRPEKILVGSVDENDTLEVEVKLTEEQYAKIIEFEKKHIPDHGPCETVLGELFRAMRYVEYRAGNDGDCYHTIGTPNFISNLYIMSTLDIINFNWLYEKELQLSSPILNAWVFDNRIHWDGMLFEFEMIKMILIELLEAGVITDCKNEMDSRDFTQIKKENCW